MINDIGQFLHELDRCAVISTELRCPEYSFKIEINPWQHPCLDKNIHRLVALITALGNTCGGLIYLVADDPQTKIPSKVVETFQSRLIERLAGMKITFIVRVPLTSWKQRPWIAIHLKKIQKPVKYVPWYAKGDSFLLKFRTDVYGTICIDETLPRRQQTEMAPYRQTAYEESAGGGTLSACTSDETADSYLEEKGIQPKQENESVMTSPSDTDEPQDPGMVDFSCYGSLDWGRNKKDWESYVRVNTPTVESIVTSCSMWNPTQPMTVTPSKETLVQFF